MNTKQGIFGTDVVAQIGIVVEDIEKTAKEYAGFFGVEMPEIRVTGAREEAGTTYKGKGTDARAKLAFFEMGNLQIELIEPDEHPSTWREHLDKHGEGVHHLAFMVEDMDGKIVKLGQKNVPPIQQGNFPGGKYGYMDTTKNLKIMMEILEKN
ncbi:MAG: VOC family protein [Bacillus sp. (in: Bacteria)]|nr:VOC family protein [Bacillus sp. (in: firmicutes)]